MTSLKKNQLPSPSREDIKSYLKANPDEFREIFAELNYAFTEKEVISTEGGIKLGGVLVDYAQLQTLKEEAKLIAGTELWKTLVARVTYLANRKMFIESHTYEEMIFGKAAIWNLDIMYRVVHTLANLRLTK
jgi:hypothetical protein